ANAGASGSGGASGSAGGAFTGESGAATLGGAGAGGNAGTGGGGAGGSVAGAGGAMALVGSGTISYERWEGVKGEAVSLVPVNEPPTVTMELGLFQMPDDVGQDFGARLRGFLTAPVT